MGLYLSEAESFIESLRMAMLGFDYYRIDAGLLAYQCTLDWAARNWEPCVCIFNAPYDSRRNSRYLDVMKFTTIPARLPAATPRKRCSRTTLEPSTSAEYAA